jgi:hypothetical protein
MISARLNYLHVHFLLGLAMARSSTEPDKDLICIAAKMLRLAVDAAIFRYRLINSGTQLVWKVCCAALQFSLQLLTDKVAHYGLPAAGVLCLSLLNDITCSQQDSTLRIKAIQDLGTLVSQIDAGVMIDMPDPNHALFAKAAKAINNVLHRAITCTTGAHVNHVDEHFAMTDNSFDWMPWDVSHSTFDFELDFWQKLGEHPELAPLPDETIIGLSY